ncbi:MAG: glycoside hydrolase family 97 catalytic domain-containing protein [Bryobacteraceae bacterium]
MRFAACILLSAVPALAADLLSLKSPAGKVEFRLLTLDGARLGYAAALNGRTVIEPSPLGIVVDGVNLAAGAYAGKAQRYKTNGTYAWHGVHSMAVDRSNGVKIPVKHGSAAYTLEARAYDDGIAFRFIVPGAPGQSRVPDEVTSFRLPAGSTVWYHDFEGHYEAVHVRKAIGEVPAGQWAAPPVTFRLPANAGYASITEGALFRYSGMGLEGDGKGGFDARLGHTHPPSYPFRLRYSEDVQRLSKPAAVEGDITTPWRVVMMGADLNALVNCDIVNNVAPPPDPKLFPKGAKTEWIKPGRAVWRYLDGGEGTIEGQKEFSRLAHDLGFEYNVLEGFWRKWSEQELKEYNAYSRAQGVGVLLWKHSKELRDPASRREFFDLCRRTGAAGAKIDFFDHEHKEVVELYEACLRDAAERHLVLDFHGANKPTGESRTFPNELTREGIRGMESRKAVRAPHDATLPFTRMLAGHADYTPVHFGDRRNDTTWAHQIASAAILTSPLLVYAANPANILKNPAAEVIKSIPSVWDETIALPASEIGEVAVFARRTGKTWFLAIMNGATARSVAIPLSFLGAGSYRTAMVRDSADDPAAVRIENGVSKRSDTLAIELRAGGGFLARFEP